LPEPLPRPVVSRATAKKIPQIPPPPQPKPTTKPKLEPVPQPQPVAPASNKPVVGHRVTRNYKKELETRIRDNLHYPRLAQRQGRQGTALVRVRMKRDGSIESIELVKSSGSESLDREAQAVFQRIGQLPALPNDFLPKASEFQFEVPIAFKLVDPFG
ncbi:MAG: energy transducer TonB, partial [Sinobacteraceae bacterium]|nr:energy transducer TonB [Nevskiaceae bacterium]